MQGQQVGKSGPRQAMQEPRPCLHCATHLAMPSAHWMAVGISQVEGAGGGGGPGGDGPGPGPPP